MAKHRQILGSSKHQAYIYMNGGAHKWYDNKLNLKLLFLTLLIPPMVDFCLLSLSSKIIFRFLKK